MLVCLIPVIWVQSTLEFSYLVHAHTCLKTHTCTQLRIPTYMHSGPQQVHVYMCRVQLNL